ncbi:MAG: hypothetical protein ACRERC_21505 [Candidatus Binatia bacterium]
MTVMSHRRALLLFAGLAVVMTWPLARHLSTHLPLGRADLWQNLWNFWWWKTALLERGQSPYTTDLLFHPYGAPLAFHTHSELNQLAFLPINTLFGPVAAYGTAILAALTLAGFAAYLLARELVGDARAALVAGVIFAFYPHQMEELIEHLNLATIGVLPLACLFFLRALRRGGARNAVALGLCLAATVLAAQHYAVFLLLLLPLLGGFELAPPRRAGAAGVARIASGLGVAALVAAALAGPFMLPLLSALAGGGEMVKPFRDDRGIDLAFLLLPPDFHPLFGGLTRGYHRAHRSNPAVAFYDYLGWIPLLLACAAWPLVRTTRRLQAWLVAGVVFFILACGTRPLIAGTTIDLTLPHAWFAALPLLQTLRHAHRFIVVTMLALAVLAAAGTARLSAGGRRRWLAPLAVALVLFEYAWLPYPVQRVSFPSYLEVLARDPQAGAVLDIPFGFGGSTAINQAYQTVHGRPIAGGYVSVAPPVVEVVQRDPVLGPLALLGPDAAAALDVAHLRRLGFGTVVLHMDRVDDVLAACAAALGPQAGHHALRRCDPASGVARATMEAISDRLTTAAGTPIHDDADIRVFRLKD